MGLRELDQWVERCIPGMKSLGEQADELKIPSWIPHLRIGAATRLAFLAISTSVYSGRYFSRGRLSPSMVRWAPLAMQITSLVFGILALLCPPTKKGALPGSIPASPALARTPSANPINPNEPWWLALQALRAPDPSSSRASEPAESSPLFKLGALMEEKEQLDRVLRDFPSVGIYSRWAIQLPILRDRLDDGSFEREWADFASRNRLGSTSESIEGWILVTQERFGITQKGMDRLGDALRNELQCYLGLVRAREGLPIEHKIKVGRFRARPEVYTNLRRIVKSHLEEQLRIGPREMEKAGEVTIIIPSVGERLVRDICARYVQLDNEIKAQRAQLSAGH